MELTGIIKAIDLENNNGNDKKVVTLVVENNEICFVEFQNRNIKKLTSIEVGEIVSIIIKFNGKISRLGRKYNNLVAKSIRSLNKCDS